MQDQAEKLLALAMELGAETADVLASKSTSVNTGVRLGKLEELERAESGGIGLRVFFGKQQGVASGSDMRADSLKQIAERAVAIAKLAPEDPYTGLAERETLAKEWPQLDLVDDDEPEADWFLAQCHEAEEAALAMEGVSNSEGANAGYSRGDITLVTSDGFSGGHAKTSFSLSASVLVGQDSGMERDYAYSATRHRSRLKTAKAIGAEAAERALKRLNPRKVETCKVPVIFDPRVGRGLMGSFTSAISGASVARGTSFLKEKMGEQIFSKAINITDDPFKENGMGSRPFDGEGCRSELLNLVENGVLKHWLLDCKSARQLDMKTNGRAARGLSSGTSPSSTNVTLAAGELSPEELISELEDGFYVTETFGMGVNLITGDYSQGASGFWVEKGQLAYPVSEVTIASTLPEMFASLTAANDLTDEYATNVPTLRVSEMMVAGN